MAVSVGTRVEKTAEAEVLHRARARAALIPDLLAESRHITNTVINGWHGRRKRGIGENFWQFRPWVEGEARTKIDWRRSARDDHVYIRDKEWEAAHTLWVWADNSPSMLYMSKRAQTAKQSRAMVIALALCELLARSGERVGWPGVTNTLSHRNAAERIAAELAQFDDYESFPPTEHIKKYSELILISDFLDPVEDITRRLDTIAQRGIRGHLVQIIDPAEENFPYTGRTQFIDPESGDKFIAGRAEQLGSDYRQIFTARKQAIAEHISRLGWSHIIHHTDQPASAALVALHMHLGQDISPKGAGYGW